MATPDVINPVGFAQHVATAPPAALDRKSGQHNVRTVMNYYKDPEDGTPPTPFYVEYESSSYHQPNAPAIMCPN